MLQLAEPQGSKQVIYQLMHTETHLKTQVMFY